MSRQTIEKNGSSSKDWPPVKSAPGPSRPCATRCQQVVRADHRDGFLLVRCIGAGSRRRSCSLSGVLKGTRQAPRGAVAAHQRQTPNYLWRRDTWARQKRAKIFRVFDSHNLHKERTCEAATASDCRHRAGGGHGGGAGRGAVGGGAGGAPGPGARPPKAAACSARIHFVTTRTGGLGKSEGCELRLCRWREGSKTDCSEEEGQFWTHWWQRKRESTRLRWVRCWR